MCIAVHPCLRFKQQQLRQHERVTQSVRKISFKRDLGPNRQNQSKLHEEALILVLVIVIGSMTQEGGQIKAEQNTDDKVRDPSSHP